jgi:hypothetical protein
LFLKCKPIDIRTKVFGIHVRPLWETTIDAQLILNPYATIAYYIFYFTKIDKFVTQEM